jgi:thiol-disulfide isomerase/thioredoxin
MEKVDVTWKIFISYILILFFTLLYSNAFSQIQVSQFNAEWNKTNEVPWINKLSDCKTISYIDISKQTDMAKKHKIAVIPTIIIFKDGEEVARFQADLSFKMVATKEEVQEEIDNQLMSDF